MKRALVLNGGGSRGAYEIGAWQALDELGVRFDGVYGTSIGALNAALFAQGDLDGAVELWSNITVSQIMAVEDEDDFAIERMIHRKRDVIPFLMENARHLRMDISPLEALVREQPGRGPGPRRGHAAGRDGHEGPADDRRADAAGADEARQPGGLGDRLGLLLSHLPGAAHRRPALHRRRLLRQPAHRHGPGRRHGRGGGRGAAPLLQPPGVRPDALADHDQAPARPGRVPGFRPEPAAPQPPAGLL